MPELVVEHRAVTLSVALAVEQVPVGVERHGRLLMADLGRDVGPMKPTVSIEVKTKTSGTWHTSIDLGEARDADPLERRFWVLVDIGREPEHPPAYWIGPEWWMFNHIYVEIRDG